MNIKAPSVMSVVGKLSGGNQQKVVLSKWLFTDPDVLILDEPTRGIDVGAKYEIYTIINRLVAAGKAVVVISSELPELLGICDRIYTLSAGRITGELPVREATQESLMELMTKERESRRMTRTAPPEADPTPKEPAPAVALHTGTSDLRALLTRNLRQSGIYVAFVAIVALFAILTDGVSLSPGNITNIVLQYSYILVLAIGMVMVIIAGHIDLSVGSVVALTGAVSAVLVIQNGAALVGRHPRRARRRPGRRRLAGLLGRLRRHPGVHRDPRRHAAVPRPHPAGAGQHLALAVPGRVPARSPAASSTACSAATATTPSPCSSARSPSPATRSAASAPGSPGSGTSSRSSRSRCSSPGSCSSAPSSCTSPGSWRTPAACRSC